MTEPQLKQTKGVLKGLCCIRCVKLIVKWKLLHQSFDCPNYMLEILLAQLFLFWCRHWWQLLNLESGLRRELIKYRMSSLSKRGPSQLSMREFFTQPLWVENTSLIVHQREEMPCFLILRVDRGCLLTMSHDNLVIILIEVDFVFIVPLAEFEIALTFKLRLNVSFLFKD